MTSEDKIEQGFEQEIEDAIQETGKTAPRLTPADIDAAIVSEQYWRPHNSAMIVCVLTLRNGFNTVGWSAPVSPENFDGGIGIRIAREKARDKIWELEGYLLKEKLSKE